ncbi:gut-specific cysteine proteinase-like [Paramacrobiotus metropolitanus]|uniref:gut-specific cysteine proteinase-like n=1 Tax=Paramacrobiotus metropolitanus TaxID=2943436 RepID=UPI002446534A|nr:gut-specific cysteine proteinase-like [Paramacrobiotus metropolitanus]
MQPQARVLPVLLLLTASCADKPLHPKPGTIPLTPEQLKQQPKFIATHRHRAVGEIPECFDAREEWSQCKSISDIRDQAHCGSCWAVASASVLSDRICICELAAGKEPSQTYASASYIASCSFDRANKSGHDNCDTAGYPSDFFRWAATRGYITGGNYHSQKGCQPYPFVPLQLTCAPTCTNPEYDKKTVVEDTAYIDSYYVSPLAISSGQEARSQERIDAQVLRIQTDILVNGPVVAYVYLYKSWYKWNPKAGNCVVKVSVDGTGQISLLEKPVPIGKIFVAAPAGPISFDQAGVCTPVDGSPKFDCSVATATGTASASTVVGKDYWELSHYFANKSL